MTSEGSLVVIHDATVERTTDGHGRVRELTVDYLRSLRAGPNGERIPLLEEVLALTGDHDLVVEVHDSGADVAAAVVRALRRLNARSRERTIVASESTRLIHAVRRDAPRIRTAATARAAWCKVLLDRAHLLRWAPRGHAWMVPEVHRGLHVVTRRFAEAAARAGDELWVFVVEDAADVVRLRQIGVTGCFTTRPASLSAALAAGHSRTDALHVQ